MRPSAPRTFSSTTNFASSRGFRFRLFRRTCCSFFDCLPASFSLLSALSLLLLKAVSISCAMVSCVSVLSSVGFASTSSRNRVASVASPGAKLSRAAPTESLAGRLCARVGVSSSSDSPLLRSGAALSSPACRRATGVACPSASPPPSDSGSSVSADPRRCTKRRRRRLRGGIGPFVLLLVVADWSFSAGSSMLKDEEESFRRRRTVAGSEEKRPGGGSSPSASSSARVLSAPDPPSSSSRPRRARPPPPPSVCSCGCRRCLWFLASAADGGGACGKEEAEAEVEQ
jgi:hypothetical protein